MIALGRSSGRSAGTTISVVPLIAVAPATGSAGSQAVVHGLYFAATEPVTATWIGPGGARGPVLGMVNTSKLGSFGGATALTVTVPMSSTGAYTISALGQVSKGVATVPFTIR